MWVSGRRPLLCLDVWRNGACRAVTILSRVALGAQRAALVRRTMASSASHGPVYTAIVRKVTESLAPEALELHDDSASHTGHAGMKGREAVESHFKLRVVSEKFDGVPLVKRHQLVYSLLDEEFKAGLHALNITAKTPKEIEKAAARE